MLLVRQERKLKSTVDRAKAFYEKLGFHMDIDFVVKGRGAI